MNQAGSGKSGNIQMRGVVNGLPVATADKADAN